MKKTILKRCGRYALIEREQQYENQPSYIVACGYDEKTGEWNQGYYHHDLETATAEFGELSGNACVKCRYVNDGCIICKI